MRTVPSYLCADHGCTLSNAAQSLSKVTAAAYKWHLKVVLVDVVDLISRGQHLQDTGETRVACVSKASCHDIGLHLDVQ